MKRRSLSRFKQVAAINARVFAAFVFGALAWLLWPSSVEWWQFFVFGGLMIAGAVSFLSDAIWRCLQLYEHDQAVAEFRLIGGDPKSSDVASNETLKKAGMIK